MSANTDDMVAGYRAGLRSNSSELPECHKSKSPAFKHGWMNGRDDRAQSPREKASVLRARAGMITGEIA